MEADLLDGVSGAGKITTFDPEGLPVQIAAEVKDFHLERLVPDCSRWSASGPNSFYAAAAAYQALSDAGVLDKPGTSVSLRISPPGSPGIRFGGPFDSSEEVALFDVHAMAGEKLSGRVVDDERYALVAER